VPTLEALETAIADHKRTQALFDELTAERADLQMKLATVQQKISTAKASFSANEEALRDVAAQYAREAKRGTP
jgi:septal ring factor EnvC (AmiA/AmiB activator)